MRFTAKMSRSASSLNSWKTRSSSESMNSSIRSSTGKNESTAASITRCARRPGPRAMRSALRSTSSATESISGEGPWCAVTRTFWLMKKWMFSVSRSYGSVRLLIAAAPREGRRRGSRRTPRPSPGCSGFITSSIDSGWNPKTFSRSANCCRTDVSMSTQSGPRPSCTQDDRSLSDRSRETLPARLLVEGAGKLGLVAGSGGGCSHQAVVGERAQAKEGVNLCKVIPYRGTGLILTVGFSIPRYDCPALHSIR